MNSKFYWLLFLVAIMVLCLAGWTRTGTAHSPGASQWYYRVGQDLSQDQLADDGQNGWELVAVTVDDISSGSGHHYRKTFYFKKAAN